ncbi:hypothetical protein scyTo_0001662 [Scyliorhinus torazame]|uniref:DBIRD complex subunit ZNF326 n=1 Tax=Scyliorhinus torazame TaxID=75743 RepID=A0A401PEX9_SCYTO|nr:hypothetical protein [Scyliorhinus torazame]
MKSLRKIHMNALMKSSGENYTEKFSEDVRNSVICSLCKFRTTEQEVIEAHLEMPDHKETYAFIGMNIQFGKRAADSLDVPRVNNNKKIADRKQWQQQEQQLQQEMLEVALQKQDLKRESEYSENETCRKEMQGLMEAGHNLEKALQRLCHDVQV